MRVKDLIKKLSKLNPDARVILYLELGEQDGEIEDVEYIPHLTHNHIEYVCTLDAVAENYLGKPIVYLKG